MAAQVRGLKSLEAALQHWARKRMPRRCKFKKRCGAKEVSWPVRPNPDTIQAEAWLFHVPLTAQGVVALSASNTSDVECRPVLRVRQELCPQQLAPCDNGRPSATTSMRLLSTWFIATSPNCHPRASFTNTREQLTPASAQLVRWKREEGGRGSQERCAGSLSTSTTI